MPEPVSLLMREFLTWVADRPRTYAEAMEAWRSNCPRQSVWEDALIARLIQVEGDGRQAPVTLTPRGWAVLGGDTPSVGNPYTKGDHHGTDADKEPRASG